MASKFSQMIAKTSLGLKCSQEISSEVEVKPDLLVSGFNLIKGTDYSIAEFDEPLPVKRPKVRYFLDIPPTKPSLCVSKGMNESLDSYTEDIDYSQIVCMKCGEIGHVICNNKASEQIQIKWKPEIDYKEMIKKKKELPQTEIKLKDNDDIVMNIACHLKTIIGNTKAKSNRSVVIEEKFKKHKMRVKRSKRVYCCKCGDYHKFAQCPLRSDTYMQVPSDSDESIITIETSVSDSKTPSSKPKFNKWNNARRKMK